MPPRTALNFHHQHNNSNNRPTSAIYLGSLSDNSNINLPSSIGSTDSPLLPDLPEFPSPGASISSKDSGLPSPPATNSTGSGSTGVPASAAAPRPRALSFVSNASASSNSGRIGGSGSHEGGGGSSTMQHAGGSAHRAAPPRTRGSGGGSRSNSRQGRYSEGNDADDDDEGYEDPRHRELPPPQHDNEDDQTARIDRRARQQTSDNMLALQRVKNLAQKNKMVCVASSATRLRFTHFWPVSLIVAQLPPPSLFLRRLSTNFRRSALIPPLRLARGEARRFSAIITTAVAATAMPMSIVVVPRCHYHLRHHQYRNHDRNRKSRRLLHLHLITHLHLLLLGFLNLKRAMRYVPRRSITSNLVRRRRRRVRCPATPPHRPRPRRCHITRTPPPCRAVIQKLTPATHPRKEAGPRLLPHRPRMRQISSTPACDLRPPQPHPIGPGCCRPPGARPGRPPQRCTHRRRGGGTGCR